MSFNTGEEVVVSLIKSQKAGSCEAVIIDTKEDRLQLALKGLGIILRHGNLLHIRSLTDENRTAWSSVEYMTLAGDVKIVSLSNIRYEGLYTPRATRYPLEFAITANYSDRQDNTKLAKGQSLDISVSGMRAKLETPLSVGTLVHVNLKIANEKMLDAVAKVVRVCDSAKTASGGFEVGLEFQRFLRGYEHLIQATQSEVAA